MFRLFSEVLPGKRVLALTPFEISIRANFSNRTRFFPEFEYPEYELLTYNTPITYAGLPPDFYPDQDWFETVERIKGDLCNLEFDIALMSCGAYSMPLGLYIRDILGKKAIYVGGCLQLFFGITGRRYQDPYFIDQIDPSAFIFPLERERFLPFANVGPKTVVEAFGGTFECWDGIA